MTTSTTPRFKQLAGGPGSGPHPGDGTKKDEPKPRQSKSDIAKASHVVVGAEIQRYAEEHNEAETAKALGGQSLKDNEPVDIVIQQNGTVQHGVELKTVVKNSNGKITMKGEAMARKRTWARKNKAAFHTVVLDDSKVFNANGPGQHDESQRVILYRRGAGSFRLAGMYKCKDMEEVKTLMNTPSAKLPPGAK